MSERVVCIGCGREGSHLSSDRGSWLCLHCRAKLPAGVPDKRADLIQAFDDLVRVFDDGYGMPDAGSAVLELRGAVLRAFDFVEPS